jgi:hypothetical protein
MDNFTFTSLCYYFIKENIGLKYTIKSKVYFLDLGGQGSIPDRVFALPPHLKGDFWARRASYATDGAGSCAEL